MGLNLDNANTLSSLPVFDRASGFERFRPLPVAHNENDAPIDCNGTFNIKSFVFASEADEREREVPTVMLEPPPPPGQIYRHIETANDRDPEISEDQPRQRYTPRTGMGGLAL